MEPNIELRLLDYKLKIMSVKKPSIHKLMFAIVKLAFTNKTKCSFFSFTETNDDYSIVVDHYGFQGNFRTPTHFSGLKNIIYFTQN